MRARIASCRGRRPPAQHGSPDWVMWHHQAVNKKGHRGGDLTSRATVAALVGYGLLTLVWRSVLQWQRTGDAGLRLSGELPPRARVSNALMSAGFLAGLAAATRNARRRAQTSDQTSTWRLLGLGLIVVATMITYRSQLDLGTSWRVGVDERERTDLVTSGLFSLVRNPIFSGMATAAIGTTFAVRSAMAYLAATALIVGMEIQVRTVEEPYLLRTHGQAYRAYASRTGRFVPRVGHISAT